MDERLDFTLSGRLRNIVLSPSSQNCMVPLYEAITNSLHAIEDRFGTTDLKQGFVTIAIERENEKIVSFRIDDNGEGLTPSNYKSFITSDSRRKIARGGKGVGRLTWLKVFEKIDVDSYYAEGDTINRLSFSFVCDDSTPIKSKTIITADSGAHIGTSVRMEGMAGAFQARAPKRQGSIADGIVRHFIAYMVSDNAPRFELYDFDNRTNLSEYFTDSIFDQKTEDIRVELENHDPINIHVHHLLVGKNLRDVEIGYNTVYLNAHGRNVERYAIDTQLGLQTLRDQYVYMAVVSSPFFDDSVSQERTHLTADKEDLTAIKRAIWQATRSFLAEDVLEVRKDQREKAKRVVDHNPRFMAVVGDLETFVEEHLPMHVRGEEDIHLELERHYRRERNRQAKEFLQAKKTKKEDEIEAKLKAYVGFLNDDIKYSLAEYVIRRKSVLDAIYDAQAYEDEERKRHHLEEVIHEYVCPLRSTSDDLTYDDHNLWIIDDRLAFYNYFASDKQIRSFQPASTDRKEPDIALFDMGLGLRREGTDQPVVIVEFKRPGRKEYGKERPVEQLLRYVSSLRSGGDVEDKNGRKLSSLGPNTWFMGYVVADLTDGLKDTLLGSIVNRPTPDGQGLWGFEETLRTYVEVIPYEKLFRDAKTRNEVFFSKLRLQS